MQKNTVNNLNGGDDTISRQAVLSVLNRNMSNGFRDYNGDWWDPTIDMEAINEIKALPSAQPSATDTNVATIDAVSRQAAIEALNVSVIFGRCNEKTVTFEALKKYAEGVRERIDALPSAQPKITYQTCSDALLKMWIDNVLTDGEYNRIMNKLNAWKGNPNAD